MRLLSFFALLVSVCGFSCLDDSGASTDLWVAIKDPNGCSYSIYSSSTNTFHTSPYSMNDTTAGALSHTLSQLWSKDTDSYGLWNDEVPISGHTSSTHGHTKGVFALDKDGAGFVLVHSIPLFPIGPSNASSYEGLPGTANTYGQSLLCISVDVSTINSLAFDWMLYRPQVYDSQLPTLEHTGNISALLHGTYSTKPVCTATAFETVGGTSMIVFAKSSQWDNDLYSACVAPTLQSTLTTETWIRGSAIGPSCPSSGYDVFDSQSVMFESVKWSSYNDHSKWAVAWNVSMVCIGDINRMTTQYTRGGGTVCFHQPIVQTTFEHAVQSEDSCLITTTA